MVSVLRAVDNAISLSKLQGCPQDIMDGGLICRNHFLVYSTREKKRRIHRMIAYLHPHKVVLARPHREKRKRKEGEYEFYEALEVRGRGRGEGGGGGGRRGKISMHV